MMNMQREPDSALGRPVRFSLQRLLLLPLFVSPLFLSTVFVRREMESYGEQSAATFFNLLACTVIYAAIFTARSRHRLYESGEPVPRHVLPAAWAGVRYGIVFMLQVILPWFLAAVIARARRFDISIIDYLCTSYSQVLALGASFAGIIGLFGVFLGAFGGCIIGLLLEWRYARRPMIDSGR
jgi:hypothetical protein